MDRLKTVARTHTLTLSRACTYHSVTLSLLRRLTSIKQIRSKSRAAVTSCRRETGGGEVGLVQQNTVTTLIKINDLQLAAHVQLDNPPF